jgi:hypothetical protein
MRQTIPYAHRSLRVTASAVLRILAWALPLALAALLALPHRPWLLYSNGLPKPDEVDSYRESHQGLMPPLPVPLRASYMLIDEQGASFFRQTASIGNRDFHFHGAEPGRFDMIYLLQHGIGWQIYAEPIELRVGHSPMGFICRTSSAAARASTFLSEQYTVPLWFLVALGIAPSLVIGSRSVIWRRLLLRTLERLKAPRSAC